MAANVGAFANDEERARKVSEMSFVVGEAGGSVDGVVVGEIVVEKMDVPTILWVIHHHGKYLGHCVVDPLNAAMAGIPNKNVGCCL